MIKTIIPPALVGYDYCELGPTVSVDYLSSYIYPTRTRGIIIRWLIFFNIGKACEINPDAVLFIRIKDLRTHFQALFDR